MNAGARDRLIGFTLTALPDSIAQRKAILTDVLACLTPQHRLRRQVVEMIQFLEAHEQSQLSLALDFQKQTNPARDGDTN